MAWTAGVVALRESLEASVSPRPPRAGGFLDARLRGSVTPAWLAPEPEAPERVEFWHPLPSDLRGQLAQGEEEGGGSHGLVSCAKSETARGPYGLKGLSKNGKRQILRSGAVLRDFPKCLGFWTVTLPDEVLIPMLDQGLWPKFQDRIRKELKRLLVRAGLPGLLVGVVEIHPRRSRDAGRPLPHLHVVFQGKRNRWHHWALDRWQLDGVIASALRTCGFHGIDLRAAGRLETVRKDAAAYMAKYISKGGETPLVGAGEGYSPVSQWWFRTRPLKAMVDLTTFQLPARFLGWLGRECERLEGSGVLRWWRFDVADPRAPATFGFRFLGLGELAAAVAEWMEEEEDAKLWAERYPNSLWRP